MLMTWPGSYFRLRDFRWRWCDMFIRFMSGEADEDSQVAAGLFVAASRLWYGTVLPDYEYECLSEVLRWFNLYLPRPARFSRSTRAVVRNRGICWFRSSATEHIRKAWEMVAILERNDLLIRMIKSEKVGYVVYEDDFQVVAEPFADMHLLK